MDTATCQLDEETAGGALLQINIIPELALLVADFFKSLCSHLWSVCVCGWWWGGLERAAGSRAVCTFKYATLRTRDMDDTVTLKRPEDW